MATVLNAALSKIGAGKQSAQGSAASAPAFVGRHVRGGLGINEETFEENYADGSRTSSPQRGKSTITGGGSPAFEARPRDLLWWLAMVLGSESVSTVDGDGNYTHTLHESNGAPWLTLWRQAGTGSVTALHKFVDSKVSGLVLEASRSEMIAKVTPTIISLDPEVATSIPAADFTDDEDAFELADLLGNFDFDGIVPTGAQISNFQLSLEDTIAAYYGESPIPSYMIPGRLTIRFTATALLTDEMLQIYNLAHFDNATPSAGDKPSKNIYQGSLAAGFSRGSGSTLESVSIDLPAVDYSVDDAFDPQPDGGANEIAITGTARLGTGESNIITVTGVNKDSAAY